MYTISYVLIKILIYSHDSLLKTLLKTLGNSRCMMDYLSTDTPSLHFQNFVAKIESDINRVFVRYAILYRNLKKTKCPLFSVFFFTSLTQLYLV